MCKIAFEEIVILAKNRSGWKLIEYIDIKEDDIERYHNVTRERNLGKCCGKSVQWLRDNIEQQEKTIDDRLFSDAESRRDEWNRLKPFFDEIMSNDEENIIIVSHGDLLSVFNTMFLGLDVETINACEMFGLAGGVSYMFENNEGKRFIKRISDMSYI